MTEKINATQEVFVFVPLFKNIYEKSGKRLVSYKPGYVKKEDGSIGTFPVGLGSYENYMDGDYKKQKYDNSFWLSVAVNGSKSKSEDPDIYVSLNHLDTKKWTKIGLHKKNYEGKISFSIPAPIEVGGTKYRITLTKNTNKDKPQDLNIIFKEAIGVEVSTGSEEEILFDDLEF